MTYDLADGGPEELKAFAACIIDLAAAHHDSGVRVGAWSGRDLCRAYASDWRGLHCRLASSLYNNARRSLNVRGKL